MIGTGFCRRLGLLAGASTLILGAAGTVHAQSAGSTSGPGANDAINRIEQQLQQQNAQIQQMQAAMQHLQQALQARDAELKAVRAEVAQGGSAPGPNRSARPMVSSVSTEPPEIGSEAAAPITVAQRPGVTSPAPVSPNTPGWLTNGTPQQQTEGNALSLSGSSPPVITQAVVDTTVDKFRIGNVVITPAFQVNAVSIFRSRNMTSDVASNFGTGVPLPNSPNYHLGEFRESARATRIGGLAQSSVTPTLVLSAFLDADFQVAGSNSNSNQGNGYTIRLRDAYTTIDAQQSGWHFLAGQSWSLITPTQVSTIPRLENIPIVIDGQILPGFSWTRQPQIRVFKEFANHKITVAVSAESPQTTYSLGANGAFPTGTTTTTNPGGMAYASTVNYSVNPAPDLIAKLAFDPGWGHYEIYGMQRYFEDRLTVSGVGSTKVTSAASGGASAILPVVAHYLTLEGSVLAGSGIGRYGSASLPDATVGSGGEVVPLREVEAQFGVIAHPIPSIDVYSYYGVEQQQSAYFNAGGKGYGFGNPLYSNAGCESELSSLTCTGTTSGVTDATAGFWWRAVKGRAGQFLLGAQYQRLHRNTFTGVGGEPHSDDDIVMFSIKYNPFAH